MYNQMRLSRDFQFRRSNASLDFTQFQPMDLPSVTMIVTLILSQLSNLEIKRLSTTVRTTKTTNQTQTFTKNSILRLSSLVAQKFLYSCGTWICYLVMSLLAKLELTLKIGTSLLIGGPLLPSQSSIDSSTIQVVQYPKVLSNCGQKLSQHPQI